MPLRPEEAHSSSRLRTDTLDPEEWKAMNPLLDQEPPDPPELRAGPRACKRSVHKKRLPETEITVNRPLSIFFLAYIRRKVLCNTETYEKDRLKTYITEIWPRPSYLVLYIVQKFL